MAGPVIQVCHSCGPSEELHGPQHGTKEFVGSFGGCGERAAGPVPFDFGSDRSQRGIEPTPSHVQDQSSQLMIRVFGRGVFPCDPAPQSARLFRPGSWLVGAKV